MEVLEEHFDVVEDRAAFKAKIQLLISEQQFEGHPAAWLNTLRLADDTETASQAYKDLVTGRLCELRSPASAVAWC